MLYPLNHPGIKILFLIYLFIFFNFSNVNVLISVNFMSRYPEAIKREKKCNFGKFLSVNLCPLIRYS